MKKPQALSSCDLLSSSWFHGFILHFVSIFFRIIVQHYPPPFHPISALFRTSFTHAFALRNTGLGMWFSVHLPTPSYSIPRRPRCCSICRTYVTLYSIICSNSLICVLDTCCRSELQRQIVHSFLDVHRRLCQSLELLSKPLNS